MCQRQIDLDCVQCNIQRQPVEWSLRMHLPGITGHCPKPGFKLFTGELLTHCHSALETWYILEQRLPSPM